MKPVQFAGIHYVNLYRGPAPTSWTDSPLQPIVDRLHQLGYSRRTSSYKPEGKHYGFVASPYNDDMPQSIASDSTFLIIDNGLGQNEEDTALADLVIDTLKKIHPERPHAQRLDLIFTNGEKTGAWYRAVGKSLGFSYVFNFQDHPEEDRLLDRLAFRLASYQYTIVPIGTVLKSIMAKILKWVTG